VSILLQDKKIVGIILKENNPQKKVSKSKKTTFSAEEYANAIHEAGHAVAFFVRGIKFKRVSLELMTLRKKNYIDTFIVGISDSEFHKYWETPVERCLDNSICALAGAAAESVYNTRPQSDIMKYSDTDMEQANYLCRKAGIQIETARAGAAEIVEKYGPQITLIAKELLDSQKLSYIKMQRLLDAYKKKSQSTNNTDIVD
jgi:hypothetical protein